MQNIHELGDGKEMMKELQGIMCLDVLEAMSSDLQTALFPQDGI